jgi:L-lactate dehydrogenase (cytochrome)/(S)-mandelate dehydrogenase
MTTFKYLLTAGRDPLNVDDYRRLARRSVPDMVWAFFDYGAEDNVTMAANRAAFARYALRQRVLVGNDPVDLSTTVAGEPLSLPVLLAPTGLAGLVHWSGEPAAARAAEQAGTLAVLSTASSYSYEEVDAATEKKHFFQLYPYHDKSSSSGSLQNNVVASLMERAQTAGYKAMFVTADVPMSGNKEAERRRGLGKPPTMTPRRALDGALHPRWAYGFLRYQRISMRNLVSAGGTKAAMDSIVRQERMMRRELSWTDLAWMRSRWTGPLYVKGVLDADDAARAVDVGADGIVVSNHGGRQLDGAVASLDALPAIADRVGGQTEILLDGGIRRGTDVIKAISLGARAVLIGRPYLYGLAARGEPGVRHVLSILGEEMSRAMTIMGVKSVKELDPGCVLPAGVPLAP